MTTLKSTIERWAEEYIYSRIPLGHTRTGSDMFQEIQKEAFFACYKKICEWAKDTEHYTERGSEFILLDDLLKLGEREE